MAKDDVIVKEAVIRGKNVRGCPFGLPIPEACENVGSSIHRMAPIEDEENAEDIEKANRLVYAYHKECRGCPYAEKVLKEHGKVDCDFGDTAAGKKTPALKGSPLYPQTFHGIGLDGLYGYPLGFYADNNESRNLFFGLFSLLGFSTVEELIKLGDQYDKSNENEKADLLDGLLIKLKSIKDEYKDTFDKIEKYLAEHRQKFEDKRADTGLLWELSDAWFGPRQVNR
jgi:hypothetical protein